MNQSNDVIEVEGVVSQLFPNTVSKVRLDGTKEDVLCHISGKMRKRYIKLTAGDRVKVEISKYDTSRGRIVYRLSGTTHVRRRRPFRKR